jgi:glutaminyl-tRNA synthetase
VKDPNEERTAPSVEAAEASEPRDFIRSMIAADVAAGRHGGRVATRFPPEPNGYLHIGHAKSICLNFGLAEEFGGRCNLRFDDTNPETENPEFVGSIQDDVRWLGFEWDGLFHASDYFDQLYAWAEKLVTDGKAYVDSLDEEQIRAYRGTVTEPGRNSPHRERSIAENLDLLRRMKAGEFPDGAHVLRAKIDMAAANMKMRDPLLYRIRHAHHYRTGDAWCIYPMYDFAHGQSDAIEGITHSLCTLEFENNRELYDWLTAALEIADPPHQTEFARLVLNYTVLSKRKLLELVEGGHVDGWDDPRMPTISGYRRRGYTPEAIREFCDRIGVAKANSVVDVGQLEAAVRDDLNTKAPRVLAVLRPLKVVVENYPAGGSEELEAPYWPHDVPGEGSRPLPFSRELWIERDDFAEQPPKGFKRLAPGREVRLRYAYFLRCERVVKDPESGEVVELRCSYDPATRGGSAPDGRKVAGTIHWLSAAHALPAEVRLYDRLFSVENPNPAKGGPDFKQYLNPQSLEVVENAWVEPSLADAAPGSRFQFERLGYFYLGPQASAGAPTGGGRKLAFNRIVSLRDSWARQQSSEPAARGERPTGGQPAEPASKPSSASAPAALSAVEQAAFDRYRAQLALGEDEARVLATSPRLAVLFAAAIEAGGPAAEAARWLVHELPADARADGAQPLPFTGGELAELATLANDGTISGPVAKELFAEMVREGGSPRRRVEERGLQQVTDSAALAGWVDGVLSHHPDEVAAYRGGKSNLLGFFVGQVMRESRGKADPQQVNALLRERLG